MSVPIPEVAVAAVKGEPREGVHVDLFATIAAMAVALGLRSCVARRGEAIVVA